MTHIICKQLDIISSQFPCGLPLWNIYFSKAATWIISFIVLRSQKQKEKQTQNPLMKVIMELYGSKMNIHAEEAIEELYKYCSLLIFQE